MPVLLQLSRLKWQRNVKLTGNHLLSRYSRSTHIYFTKSQVILDKQAAPTVKTKPAKFRRWFQCLQVLHQTAVPSGLDRYSWGWLMADLHVLVSPVPGRLLVCPSSSFCRHTKPMFALKQIIKCQRQISDRNSVLLYISIFNYNAQLHF